MAKGSSPSANVGWKNPGLAKIAGTILIAYYFILIPLRVYAQGPSALYEMLWGCNVALLICGFGCFLRSELLIGSGIALVSFPHLSWNLDVITYFLTGSFPFGVASYIIWPQTHNLIIATTLHHIWMLPLCFAVLRGNGRLRWTYILVSVIYVFILGGICRFFTPLTYDGVYLNVNMAHEWWKDSEGDFFHQFDKAHPLIYLSWASTVANMINAVAFIFWKLIYDLGVNRGQMNKIQSKSKSM